MGLNARTTTTPAATHAVCTRCQSPCTVCGADFEAGLAFAPRLTNKQRAAMHDHFRAIPSSRFLAECLVYVGREMRFSPRHRDLQGLADLQRIAILRGLSTQFESACARIDVEIWSDIPAQDECTWKPRWESKARAQYQRHLWEAKVGNVAHDHDGQTSRGRSRRGRKPKWFSDRDRASGRAAGGRPRKKAKR